MSVHQFKRTEETTNQPINIGDRAFDNLRFIRETMERSASFTAIPGYGGALMGFTAIGAAIIANYQPNFRLWLITWLAEAILAFAIGVFAMWQKSKNIGSSLNSAPSRKFIFGFAPPLVAGILLTALLYRISEFAYLPSVWLTLYGTAVVTGGAYSVKIVPIVGWLFIGLGLVSVMAPASYGDSLMALGFGVLQIIFGFVIARKHGG